MNRKEKQKIVPMIYGDDFCSHKPQRELPEEALPANTLRI